MPSADPNALMLGELRGQMREMIHGVNNLIIKFDSLSREVVSLGPLATDIAELKTTIAAVQVKLATLEADKNRTDGAKSLGALLLKSPALGWLVGAGISAWAVLSGKVHL